MVPADIGQLLIKNLMTKGLNAPPLQGFPTQGISLPPLTGFPATMAPSIQTSYPIKGLSSSPLQGFPTKGLSLPSLQGFPNLGPTKGLTVSATKLPYLESIGGKQLREEALNDLSPSDAIKLDRLIERADRLIDNAPEEVYQKIAENTQYVNMPSLTLKDLRGQLEESLQYTPYKYDKIRSELKAILSEVSTIIKQSSQLDYAMYNPWEDFKEYPKEIQKQFLRTPKNKLFNIEQQHGKFVVKNVITRATKKFLTFDKAADFIDKTYNAMKKALKTSHYKLQ